MQKGERYPAAPLSHEDVQRLIKEFDKPSATGIRDYAVLILMIGAGLRISEALNVQLADLDRENGIIRVRKGKRGKPRTVGMHEGGWRILGRWLRKRKELKLPDDAPLFCTVGSRQHGPGGNPVHRDNYRRTFKAKVKKAGCQGRVHPHALRHTFAFEAVKDGMTPSEIQMQLGHASLDMTQRYINHLMPKDVVETLRRRTWAYG